MSNTFRYSLLRSHPFTRHPLQAPPFVLFLCFSQDSCPATRFSLQDPALHPATPFEKGVDPKTFSADGQHPFLGKGKNLECRNNGFPGTDLWIPCAVPSVGVLCSRAWWEASSESPWVFGDASHLHDLKRPSLFRRDKVPGTKHQQTVRLRLYTLKEVFGGSKGRFFKNAPRQGVGRSPTESRQQEKGRFTVQTPERTSLFRRFLPDSATRRPPWRQAHPVFGFR